MRRNIRWGGTCVAVLLGLSACGTHGSGDGGTAVTSPATGAAGLKVASTSLGAVLVDSRGRTVYMLTSDKKGSSRCPSTCLAFWPPVAKLSGARPAGVRAPVSSTTDTAGRPMATVGGWPVYTYAQDTAPGDVTGEGVRSFGGVWYAVSPTGRPVTGKPAASASSGGGAY